MPVAVIGAGLNGKVHIDLAASMAMYRWRESPIRPDAAAASWLRHAGCTVVQRTIGRCSIPPSRIGVVIATPNRCTHAPIALDCIGVASR